MRALFDSWGDRQDDPSRGTPAARILVNAGIGG